MLCTVQYVSRQNASIKTLSNPNFIFVPFDLHDSEDPSTYCTVDALVSLRHLVISESMSGVSHAQARSAVTQPVLQPHKSHRATLHGGSSVTP